MWKLLKVWKASLQYSRHVHLKNTGEVENIVGKCEVKLGIINYTSLSCFSVQVQAKQHQFTSEKGFEHVEFVVFSNRIFK